MANNQEEEMQLQPAKEARLEGRSGQEMPPTPQPKKRCSWKTMIAIVLPLLLLAYIAYSNWDGKINRWYRWSEEVELSSGEIIWVNRSTRYYEWSDWLTQAGGVKNRASTVIFNNEKSKLGLPKWKGEGFPILLDFDRDKERWFIVETFMSCREWKKWGNPDPPYRLHELVGEAWQLMPTFDMKLVGHKGNLIINKPDRASFVIRYSFTIEERKKNNAGAGDKYQGIVEKMYRCSDKRWK